MNDALLLTELLVPILAAGGAVVFLGESVSSRLLGATAAILGGIALTLRERAVPPVTAAPPR